MSFKEMLTKTTIANICAAFIVIAGFSYGIATRNDDMVKWALGIGLGYLFGRASK